MTLIRAMNRADIRLGMELKCQAGWNQTSDDWARFLELEPEGCFVAERGGIAIGTVTTCGFGSVGWIAMLLVAPAERGRGIGRLLLNHAIAYLESRGVKSVRLDATPMGQPLYESLGFRGDATIRRFGGRLPVDGSPSQTLPARLDDMNLIEALDQRATGANRGTLLRRLIAEQPNLARLVVDEGGLGGFVVARPGSRAFQIGPCVADVQSGQALLEDEFRLLGDQDVIIDIPGGHDRAIEAARSRGLEETRRLLRMTRGEPVEERFEYIWASSGPEKG